MQLPQIIAQPRGLGLIPDWQFNDLNGVDPNSWWYRHRIPLVGAAVGAIALATGLNVYRARRRR